MKHLFWKLIGISLTLILIGWYGLVEPTTTMAQQQAETSRCRVQMNGRWVNVGRLTFSECAAEVGSLTQTATDQAYGVWGNNWVAATGQGNVYWAVNDGAFNWQFWGNWRNTTPASNSNGNGNNNSNNDSDGDGIPNDNDYCPQEAEVYNGFSDGDGCPDSLQSLIEFAEDDINTYWQQIFTQADESYIGPYNFITYNRPIRTACGRSVPNNAFYCARSHSIYLDLNLLALEFEQYGDFAPVTIIAHEWGHLVQRQLGLLNNATSLEVELQADCLAGTYAKYAEERGILEAGDLEEGGASLFDKGDNYSGQSNPWFDAQAHGSSQQRYNAFMLGFEQGLGGCFL